LLQQIMQGLSSERQLTANRPNNVYTSFEPSKCQLAPNKVVVVEVIQIELRNRRNPDASPHHANDRRQLFHLHKTLQVLPGHDIGQIAPDDAVPHLVDEALTY
jgi:hypothetical protein